jgi:hypothetical protein
MLDDKKDEDVMEEEQRVMFNANSGNKPQLTVARLRKVLSVCHFYTRNCLYVFGFFFYAAVTV